MYVLHSTSNKGLPVYTSYHRDLRRQIMLKIGELNDGLRDESCLILV